jgi:5-methylcytosine-specific restriction endonuclease McrA
MCRLCKKKLPVNYEVDHVVPLHLNGDDSLQNLQALCNTCHGTKSLDEAMGREQSISQSTRWCPHCEEYYSIYFPHTWHVTGLS